MWYKKSFLRNLVDMHIPKGEEFLVNFDPERYADNMKTAGVDTVYIYSSNCLGLCLYPTKVGIRHTEAEKRDLFGATVDACHRRGLNVVGYTNSWGTFVAKEHPEWRIVDVNGRNQGDTSRFGTCCINSPYRQYFLDRLREMVSTYDIDGLWVDMIGFWAPYCCCESCKAKYKAETGRDIPTEVNWNDPDYVSYIRFKENSITTYAQDIRKTALEARPGISVGLQCAGVLSGNRTGLTDGYFQATDYCAGDFYTNREGVNTLSRILYKLTPELPFEYMTSRCPTLSYHTIFSPVEVLITQACAAHMYKGSFLFIDAIDPDGGMNDEFYKSMTVLRDALEPFMADIDYDEKPLRDVAVYMNFDSLTVPDRFRARLYNISQAMANAHIDFDILTRKNLAEIDNYKLVILSDLDMMNDEEVDAFRNCKCRLYISGKTSLQRSDGVVMPDFMLSDIMGVSYAGLTEFQPTYIAPKTELELFGRYNARYPHMLKDKQYQVKAHDGTRIIATVKLPYSDAGDYTRFSSAISNPPWTDTDDPSITEYGKVIYSAGLIEADNQRDTQKLFTDIVRYCVQPTVELAAPDCIDFSVYKGKEKYRICLLNNVSVPVRDISVKFTLGEGEKVRGVRTLGGGRAEFTQTGNIVAVTLDELKMYENVIVEL